MALGKFGKDAAERVAWTAAQAAVGVVSAEALGIPVEYAALFAAGLSLVKVFIAKHVGKDDAALPSTE
jgi:hypothetical protein